MNTNLEAALHFIETFPNAKLFPAKWRDGHKPLVAWGEGSSGDIGQIKQWALQYPSAYFCVALTQSGLMVIDVDNKNGREGSDTLWDHELEYADLPPTFRSKTPSGGEHYVLALPEGVQVRTGVDRLGKGLDAPVMIPVPGSVTGKGTYEVISNGAIAPAPDWVINLAGRREPQTEITHEPPAGGWDQPHAVSQALSLIGATEPAVSGDKGNAHTYRLALRLRDHGISADMALSLLTIPGGWNDQCVDQRGQPCPWSASELRAIVAHAYKYPKMEAGNADPKNDFTPITDEEIPRIPTRQRRNAPKFTHVKDLIKAPLKANWLIKNFLDRDSLALLYGESGTMKSFVALDMAVAIAAEREWYGHAVKNNGPVFIIVGEGRHGISKRLKAKMQDSWLDPDTTPIFVRTAPIDGCDADSVKELAATITDMEAEYGAPALVVIDTFARNFLGDENSARDVGNFVFHLSTRILDVFHCAVLIVHHSGLTDKNRARGSSALRAALDWEYCLTTDTDGKRRRLKCTKSKDYEFPETLVFEPRVVTLDGDDWRDEDGSDITSCVLDRVEDSSGGVEGKGEKVANLPDQKKIMLNALYECIKGEAFKTGKPLTEVRIHGEVWRKAAYSRGVASDKNKSTKRNAFWRAKDWLLARGYITCENEHFFSPTGVIPD